MLRDLVDLLNPVAVWRRRRAQRECFHHDPRAGESFLRSQLIETGKAKMFWCTVCNRHWFT